MEVAGASVNPADTFQRAGQLKDWMTIPFPGVIGWDVSGTVVKLGPGARGFSEGGRVLAWAFHTYAELCAVKAQLLVRVPKGLDLADAAALPLVSMTGTQLIFEGAGVKPGQTVLVSGAMGGVGRAALFAAKQQGATVIAGVLKRQLDEAKNLHADQIIAVDDNNALNQLPAVDVVANTVRGKTPGQLMGKLKSGGTFVSATGTPENAMDYPSVRVAEFVSRQDTKNLEYIVRAVEEGKLLIPVSRKMALREAAAAHVLQEKGSAGKLLLVP